MASSGFFEGLKTAGYFILGLVPTLALILVTVISIPVFIYRWLLAHLIIPHFRPDIECLVNVKSQGMATEFMRSKLNTAPRCSIVTTAVTEGIVSPEKWLSALQKGWIEAVDKKSGQLKYPEFQQYIEQFMGYMVWKKDTSFDLKNHFHVHEIGEDKSAAESKRFVDDLLEDLLTRPYASQRSPWDFHVVQKYRDPELQDTSCRTKEKFLTAFLFRCHHSMCDGFSVLSLLVEGVSETPVSICNIAKSPKTGSRQWDNLLMPFRIIRDFGYAFSLLLFFQKTPFHVTDEEKHWKACYSRLAPIPIHKIKYIKNKLGSTFTAVMLSSISAAICHFFEKREYKGSVKNLPFGIPLPLPGHPDKLVNHATGTLIKLPIESSLDPIERLRRTEKSLDDARHTGYPAILPFLQYIAFLQVAPVAYLLFKNRILPCGLTNFPGPEIKMQFGGRKVIACHFATGVLVGDCGVGFMMLSFENDFHLATNVESAVMTKGELEEFSREIYLQIECLENQI